MKRNDDGSVSLFVNGRDAKQWEIVSLCPYVAGYRGFPCAIRSTPPGDDLAYGGVVFRATLGGVGEGFDVCKSTRYAYTRETTPI